MEHYVVAVASEGLEPLIQILPGREGHRASLTRHDLIGGTVCHPADRGVLSGGGGDGHDPVFVVRGPLPRL